MKKNKGLRKIMFLSVFIALVVIAVAGMNMRTVINSDSLIGTARKTGTNYAVAQDKLENNTNTSGINQDSSIKDYSQYEGRFKLLAATPPESKIYNITLNPGYYTNVIVDATDMYNEWHDEGYDDGHNAGVEDTKTVNYVETSTGESVPVPKGFYYVGGTLSNGVIISDNEADKYNGTTDKTTYAYTRSLLGNQFVWIPCTTSAYVKTDWGKQNAEWDTTTPKTELLQIEKYGGFYIGRYEAGLASTISEFTTNQTSTGSNQVYNQYGVPQSKAGLVPWNFIDWTHSKANAENMYNNNYVNSGLITGTQWDVILNTMKSKAGLSDSDIANSNSWGNYTDKQLTYTGRKAIAYCNSGSIYILQPFGAETTNGIKGTHTDILGEGELLTTGASSTTEKYHIFDIAGNLWEWTEENSHYATTDQHRVTRGSSYREMSSMYSASHRDAKMPVSFTGLGMGFRVVLYIK